MNFSTASRTTSFDQSGREGMRSNRGTTLFPIGAPLEDARQRKAAHIKGLRRQGFTVNRNTEAYRTYVINLDNPKKTDVGKGYIYVGQTSKSPEDRLANISRMHAPLTGGASLLELSTNTGKISTAHL